LLPMRAKRQPSPGNGQGAKKARKLWTIDGVDGDPSSMSVLLDWLTSEGNYAKYRGGGPNSGMTKTVCKLN
jgi:hypothetical protein